MKVTPLPTPASPAASTADEGTPVSVKIRERIKHAQRRFHANDNIADFIEPGELEALLDEVQGKMVTVLDSLVIDTESDHNTQHTARRVARMFIDEVFRGRYVPMPAVTEFPNFARLNELMIVGPVAVRSACSHHLVPILGKVWAHGAWPQLNWAGQPWVTSTEISWDSPSQRFSLRSGTWTRFSLTGRDWARFSLRDNTWS